jgi:hypothetical protein
MDQWPRIRRLPDGAIDYEFYRRQARVQRRTAIEALLTRKRRNGLGITLTCLARLRAAWKP